MSARRPADVVALDHPRGPAAGIPGAGLDLTSFTPSDADVVARLAAPTRTTPTTCSCGARTTTATSSAVRVPPCGCGCALAERPANPLWAGGRPRPVRRALPADVGVRHPGHRPVRPGRPRLGARAAVGDDRLVLLVDRRAGGAAGRAGGRLPAGHADRRARRCRAYGVLVQPSPMTASARPAGAAPAQHRAPRSPSSSTSSRCTTRPSTCATSPPVPSTRRRWTPFASTTSSCASRTLVQRGARHACSAVRPRARTPWCRRWRGRATCCRGRSRDLPAAATGPIVVMTGDDARKNTFGGLAGVGALRRPATRPATSS